MLDALRDAAKPAEAFESQFRGAQAASLQLPAACRQYSCWNYRRDPGLLVSASCRDLPAGSLCSPESKESAECPPNRQIGNHQQF